MICKTEYDYGGRVALAGEYRELPNCLEIFGNLWVPASYASSETAKLPRLVDSSTRPLEVLEVLEVPGIGSRAPDMGTCEPIQNEQNKV